MASKRRIVRQMPTGLYMFEDVALLVVSVIVIPAYFLATMLFKAIFLPRLTLWTALLTLLLSISLSCVLHLTFKRLLADVLRIYDLAS